MATAVLFDFYGTLAHWQDRDRARFSTALATFGYVVPDAELDAYFTRSDGVEHAEHSVSQAAYEAWTRTRLLDFTLRCGVAESHREDLVDALRALDRSPMLAYPEAAKTLERLRHDGWLIGVCSNWGWELVPYLEEVGLLDLVDVAVTSARVGARKPHPLIFERSAEALGVPAGQAVFVGDSWGPDVEGPLRMGMRAIHVWRQDERPGQQPPPLPEGAHRVRDLSGVPPLLSLW